MFCRGGNIKIASRFCRGAGIFERYKRPATPCDPEVLALVHCPYPCCCGPPIGLFWAGVVPSWQFSDAMWSNFHSP